MSPEHGPPDPNARPNSWRAIAAFLNPDVRTVMRRSRFLLLPLALSGAVTLAQDDAQVYNLSHASAGFRSAVREWLPGGALMPSVNVRVTTDARYQPGRRYSMTDVSPSTGVVRQSQEVVDESGRLP
jgi:hypothetical protein